MTKIKIGDRVRRIKESQWPDEFGRKGDEGVVTKVGWALIDVRLGCGRVMENGDTHSWEVVPEVQPPYTPPPVTQARADAPSTLVLQGLPQGGFTVAAYGRSQGFVNEPLAACSTLDEALGFIRRTLA